jgi:quercetin dioxygenase-like cupin family protein
MSSRMFHVALVPVLVTLAATLGLAAQPAGGPAPQPAAAAKGVPIRTVPLPKMDGDHLSMRLVEVTYPPGAVSQAHRHPCPVLGYVLSGTIRMQIDDNPPQDFKAGDTFVELPTNVHRLGMNPSQDTPAKFLVTFLCDKDTPLTVPEPQSPPTPK